MYVVISGVHCLPCRFPNESCGGDGGGGGGGAGKNGTCYTSEECRARGGVSGGTCAGGFGTCCIGTTVLVPASRPFSDTTLIFQQAFLLRIWSKCARMRKPK